MSVPPSAEPFAARAATLQKLIGVLLASLACAAVLTAARATEEFEICCYHAWCALSLLPGDDTALKATPRNDGLTNLEKFALGLSGDASTQYTETGYYKMDVDPDGTTPRLATFTYAASTAAKPYVSIVPFFSAALQAWQEAAPALVDDSDPLLEVYEATGDFSTGKSFFRLKIKDVNIMSEDGDWGCINGLGCWCWQLMHFGRILAEWELNNPDVDGEGVPDIDEFKLGINHADDDDIVYDDNSMITEVTGKAASRDVDGNVTSFTKGN